MYFFLFRFILQGLVRPIFIDTLRLIIEYLVQPFITGVMKPLLVTVHVASMSLSETMLVCVRPLTNVLQSVRLVEVHYTSRYSVEEIWSSFRNKKCCFCLHKFFVFYFDSLTYCGRDYYALKYNKKSSYNEVNVEL